MTIAEILGEHLTQNGLTQDEAATLLGVTQPTVNRWLLGNSTPKDEHVPKIMEMTGLSRPEVLEACHRQRVLGAGLTTRVATLEADLVALRTELGGVHAQLLEVQALLRSLQT